MEIYLHDPLIAFLCITLIVQSCLLIVLSLKTARSQKNAEKLHTAMFGLMKRIEGMTSDKRTKMITEFDHVLDRLSTRLPPVLASRAGQALYEAEKSLLQKMVSLEARLDQTPQEQEELNQIIESLESLDTQIIALTADTVHEVMLESRKHLFDNYYSPLADCVDVLVE